MKDKNLKPVNLDNYVQYNQEGKAAKSLNKRVLRMDGLKLSFTFSFFFLL